MRKLTKRYIVNSLKDLNLSNPIRYERYYINDRLRVQRKDDKYSKELGATEDDIKAAIFDSIKVSQAVYDGTVELLGMKGE